MSANRSSWKIASAVCFLMAAAWIPFIWRPIGKFLFVGDQPYTPSTMQFVEFWFSDAAYYGGAFGFFVLGVIFALVPIRRRYLPS